MWKKLDESKTEKRNLSIMNIKIRNNRKFRETIVVTSFFSLHMAIKFCRVYSDKGSVQKDRSNK